jgi:Glycine transporter
MEKLPLVLDLSGTFVFALSGALAGSKRKLDLFGVLVLSFAAATAGGIARDVLIGAIPPASINDWRYLGVSLFAGVVTFYFSSLIERMSHSVLLFDAAENSSSRWSKKGEHVSTRALDGSARTQRLGSPAHDRGSQALQRVSLPSQHQPVVSAEAAGFS